MKIPPRIFGIACLGAAAVTLAVPLLPQPLRERLMPPANSDVRIEHTTSSDGDRRRTAAARKTSSSAHANISTDDASLNDAAIDDARDGESSDAGAPITISSDDDSRDRDTRAENATNRTSESQLDGEVQPDAPRTRRSGKDGKSRHRKKPKHPRKRRHRHGAKKPASQYAATQANTASKSSAPVAAAEYTAPPNMVRPAGAAVTRSGDASHARSSGANRARHPTTASGIPPGIVGHTGRDAVYSASRIQQPKPHGEQSAAIVDASAAVRRPSSSNDAQSTEITGPAYERVQICVIYSPDDISGTLLRYEAVNSEDENAQMSQRGQSVRCAATLRQIPPEESSRTGDGDSRRVDINTATLAELQAIPHMRAKTAEHLYAARLLGVRFRRESDLLQISGITSATVRKLHPYIMMSPE